MFAFTCVFGLGASIAIGIAVWLAPAERLAPALEWFRADWHMDHIAAADWAPAWLPFTRWQDVLEDHWIAASAAARSGVAQLKAHPVQASIAAAQYVYVRAAALAARVANAVAAALPDVLRVPSAKYFAIALGIALLLSVRWRVEHRECRI
jgi:hypothetical protein